MSGKETTSNHAQSTDTAQDAHPVFAAWLALLRVPNLLTVPGDPVSGACLAAMAVGVSLEWAPLARCIAASLAFYSSGLLANDYLDRSEDAQDRPARPIPSGRIPARWVLACSLLLTLAGLCLAGSVSYPATAVAILLSASSWGYNLGIKKVALAGPALMGCCRGLNLLFGAALYGLPALAEIPVVLSAIALAALIALVTNIARHETRCVAVPRYATATIPVLLLAWLGIITLGLPRLAEGTGLPTRPSPFSLLLTAMPVVWMTLFAVPLAGKPAPALVQRSIGGLIRGLILVQAALCAATGHTGEKAALCILAAFPLAGWLGKWARGS